MSFFSSTFVADLVFFSLLISLLGFFSVRFEGEADLVSVFAVHAPLPALHRLRTTQFHPPYPGKLTLAHRDIFFLTVALTPLTLTLIITLALLISLSLT